MATAEGDEITGTGSPETIKVLEGNDFIFAADANVDIINCGKGTDTIRYDQGIDTIKGCETKEPF